MIERWELCVVREHYNECRFHSPNEFCQKSLQQVVFGDEWDRLGKRQKKAMLENLSSPLLSAAVCKLLADGWMPIGISIESSARRLLVFRRAYSENT